jgi:hypothetical protein
MDAALPHQLARFNHTVTAPEFNNTSESESGYKCLCGNSVREAKAMGCKFDSLAMAWLPEHCRDEELTAEFERAGPGGHWTYWTDAKHTSEISIEDISIQGENPDFWFHMTGHWHAVHCLYYWLKQFRSRSNGKMVEPTSDSIHHIRHCHKMILNETFGVTANVWFNS